jgi:hypothetical protein
MGKGVRLVAFDFDPSIDEIKAYATAKVIAAIRDHVVFEISALGDPKIIELF